MRRTPTRFTFRVQRDCQSVSPILIGRYSFFSLSCPWMTTALLFPHCICHHRGYPVHPTAPARAHARRDRVAPPHSREACAWLKIRSAQLPRCVRRPSRHRVSGTAGRAKELLLRVQGAAAAPPLPARWSPSQRSTAPRRAVQRRRRGDVAQCSGEMQSSSGSSSDQSASILSSGQPRNTTLTLPRRAWITCTNAGRAQTGEAGRR